MTTESPETESLETGSTEHGSSGAGSPDGGDPDSGTTEAGSIAVEIIDEGPCSKRMKAEIPAESVIDEVDSNYKQLMTTVQLPGFRKGRVPRSVLERRYAEKIEEEVREELIHTAFSDEIEKRELRVLGSPRFDNVEFKVGDPLRFEVLFETPPEFELGEFKGLEIDARPTDVPEDDIGRELESLRDQYSTWEDIPLGTLQDEDVVVADILLGRVDEGSGDESSGDEGQGDETFIQREDVYLKIGPDRVDNIQVDGLSEGLISAGSGDELEFQVQVPDDFPREDLRGQSAPLKVVVKSARRRNVPEIDAEFLKGFGVETEDELRDSLRRNLEARRRVQEEQRQEEELLEMIAKTVEMELPPSLVDHKKADLSLGMSYRLMREGKSKEEIEEILASDTSTLDDARKELIQGFILDRIADEESILVTEDEVEQRIQAIALAYNRDAQEVLDDYVERGELGELRNGLLREKVRRKIREQAKVTSSTSVDESTEGDHRSTDEEQ